VRVVLDTVILARGLIAPYSWWRRLVFVQANNYRWVVSPAIVAEYLDVLSRPQLVRKYRTVATRDLDTILDQLATATVVVPLDTPAVCRDPGDDKFLATARSGGARFIVTEDADLLDMGIYEKTTIISAEAFLRVLDAAES
jgi:putative PIN family toxin of toxin-antitoxin system